MYCSGFGMVVPGCSRCSVVYMHMVHGHGRVLVSSCIWLRCWGSSFCSSSVVIVMGCGMGLLCSLWYRYAVLGCGVVLVFCPQLGHGVLVFLPV